jgi:hypothetical protein
MAVWIDPVALETQLNELVTQEQNFVTRTTEQQEKFYQMQKFLYWLIDQNKTAAADALTQEATSRTTADSGLSDRIDALANSAGTYKATLIRDLVAADSGATTSSATLFAEGMAARNLTIIPNSEYRIVFGQSDTTDGIVEMGMTYTNFAGSAATAQISAAEAVILTTDENGAVKNAAVQENPFKRELDLIKTVFTKLVASQVALGAILKTGADAGAELLGRMSAKITEWATLHGYVFPNV